MAEPNLALVPIFAATVLLSLFIYGLTLTHNSKRKVATQILSLVPLSVSLALSSVSRIVRYFGTVFRFTALYRVLFSLYPGTEFTHNCRDDFMHRGIRRISRETTETEQSNEDLAFRVGEIYRQSGTRLSDGEAFLGFSLAIVGFFSIGPVWLTTALSLTLAIAVATRITALDSVMYVHADEDEETARLKAMIAWNRAMSSGAKILSSLAILRFFLVFDRKVYHTYLDWIFSKSTSGETVRRRDVVTGLWRPIYAIFMSKIDGTQPEQKANELYGEDVFEISESPENDCEGKGDS